MENINHIRQMRIGSSMLTDHQPYHYTDPQNCPCCEQNVIETNHHYVIKCPKFHDQRQNMMKRIEPICRQLQSFPSTRILLGYKPLGCNTKDFNNVHNKILQIISDYIKCTQRFNKPKWIKPKMKRGGG